MSSKLLREIRKRYKVVGSVVVNRNRVADDVVRRVRAGSLAGSEHCGYIMCEFSVDGKRHYILAHRIAWMLHNNKFIKASVPIDHIDGNKKNNHPDNLRAVDAIRNGLNKRKAFSNSESSLLGVHWSRNMRRWRASLRYGGVLKNLGYFTDIVDAVRAYWAHKRTLDQDMDSSWKSACRDECRLARSLYAYGIGQDGKPTRPVTQVPIVSRKLLAKLEARNEQRYALASKSKSRLKALRLRLMFSHGLLVWRSASGRVAHVGCVAGNKRSDGRTMVELTVRGQDIQLSTAAISWMLVNNKELPEWYRIKHIDGDKSNIAVANLHIVTRR